MPYAETPLRRGNYKVIYSFNGGENDGSLPAAEDAPLAVRHGLLSGTTGTGGGTGCGANFGCGTVFQATQLGAESVIYSFKGQPDGANPSGALISVNGAWYGMTQLGGATGNGAVFAVDRSGHERVVYSFKGGSDGSLPFGRLIAFQGTLYGTTVNGGKHRLGTIFALIPSGSERVRYSFGSSRYGGTDGEHPYAGLTPLGGTLYGTTIDGGTDNFGTVFAISTLGKERVVYSFKYGNDGASPQAPLISVDGELYGTTTDGGGQGHLGTVFEVNASGDERVLHRFQYSLSDGVFPQSALLDLNNRLYGTTSAGGRHDDGIVFSLTLSGNERVLHNFGGTPDGRYPTGGVAAIDNTLYGTTTEGGTGACYYGVGCGTLFALTP